MSRRLTDSARLLEASVRETVAALDLTEADTAAKELAYRYARLIDRSEFAGEPEVLDQIGPKLLAVLESLGATPLARSRLKRGDPAVGKPNQLAQLRAARK